MGTEYKFDGLDEWEKRLAKVIESQYPKEFEEMVIDLAVQLEEKVKELTPQQTGHLRREWHVGNLVKRGDEYYIEVYNNVEYAEAVEYGHRQKPGRFVPAIGKRLVNDFVPGKHMMELSLQEVQRHLPGYLKEWMNDFLNSHEL